MFDLFLLWGHSSVREQLWSNFQVSWNKSLKFFSKYVSFLVVSIIPLNTWVILNVLKNKVWLYKFSWKLVDIWWMVASVQVHSLAFKATWLGHNLHYFKYNVFIAGTDSRNQYRKCRLLYPQQPLVRWNAVNRPLS